MSGTSPTPHGPHPDLDQPLRLFAWVDALIITLILTGTSLSLPAFHTLAPDRVVIYKENSQIATYPLENDRTFSINGVHGPVEISIKNRSVSIAHSTCPHGICMKAGSISRPHAQIVCAPNHIMLTITSSAEDSIDAIAR
jgi:hypothetical protein